MTIQNKIEIYICYLIFLLMGLFHLLNIFNNEINNLFSPLYVLIFLWVVIKFLMSNNESKNTSVFFFIVYFTSMAISLLIFRNDSLVLNFHFGTILKPQILSVPIIAGLIWLNSMFISTALIQRLHYFNNSNIVIKSILIGLSFLVFDIYLEPAAGRLGFWYWGGTSIPFLNYIIWFCFGTVMGYTGLKLKIFTNTLPAITLHLYVAQVIFFLIIFFS